MAKILAVWEEKKGRYKRAMRKLQIISIHDYTGIKKGDKTNYNKQKERPVELQVELKS